MMLIVGMYEGICINDHKGIRSIYLHHPRKFLNFKHLTGDFSDIMLNDRYTETLSMKGKDTESKV